jgi:hypothetical protein
MTRQTREIRRRSPLETPKNADFRVRGLHHVLQLDRRCPRDSSLRLPRPASPAKPTKLTWRPWQTLSNGDRKIYKDAVTYDSV